ncbi:MAG TPA: hemerythrin domain-containing protein [Accumulibacter sp.]|jgi:hemerythrin-like domain-containing protein|nr:hemerythrin domain-containing protein [Accumulibacter sp.]HNF60905.1 hemerythrin domain-containing protein [Rhodocyclaceae bacterium]
MLSACHDRIETQCATLRRLVPHLLVHGVDEEARAAATRIIRYFDTSALHHHADEEDDLFPALIESMAGSDAICLRDMIDGLTADHRALAACWRHLRAILERIAAGERVPLLFDDVEALAVRYERHIEREEKELLPMAARLLSDDDLARIGRAMRARRGIDEA